LEFLVILSEMMRSLPAEIGGLSVAGLTRQVVVMTQETTRFLSAEKLAAGGLSGIGGDLAWPASRPNDSESRALLAEL
jgi:hypothetical protein